MVMDNEEEKTIRSYYTELKELVGDKAVELKGRYKVLYRIFNDILNRETADCPYSFAGPFPRLNYVVRENEITHEQFSLLNNLRLHCRSFEEYSPKELTGMFLYDTKVLTDFIERIYHLPVPSDLKSILPITNPKIIEPKGKSPYLRISVERWDETYIYGTSSSSDSETVKVNYVDGPHGDRSYLPSLLQPNTQLNLINSVFAAGIYTPELIILEPDYLVDVTGVARCFTNYGNTAHNYLLNKIKPDVTSAAILLGNLASQFLDELINDRSKSGVHYADSVKKFSHNVRSTSPLAWIWTIRFTSTRRVSSTTSRISSRHSSPCFLISRWIVSFSSPPSSARCWDCKDVWTCCKRT
jgi:hypothetical protein